MVRPGPLDWCSEVEQPRIPILAVYAVHHSSCQERSAAVDYDRCCSSVGIDRHRHCRTNQYSFSTGKVYKDVFLDDYSSVCKTGIVVILSITKHFPSLHNA